MAMTTNDEATTEPIYKLLVSLILFNVRLSPFRRMGAASSDIIEAESASRVPQRDFEECARVSVRGTRERKEGNYRERFKFYAEICMCPPNLASELASSQPNDSI